MSRAFLLPPGGIHMERQPSGNEKDVLKRMCADLLVDVLWCPDIRQAHGETDEHELDVTKENGEVIARLKRK